MMRQLGMMCVTVVTGISVVVCAFAATAWFWVICVVVVLALLAGITWLLRACWQQRNKGRGSAVMNKYIRQQRRLLRLKQLGGTAVYRGGARRRKPTPVWPQGKKRR